MNLDDFTFNKQNGSYTASLLEYIKKIQKESDHEDIASVQFESKKLDDDLNTPDIYIYDPVYNCKIHLFNHIDSDYESSYSFAKAGTFKTYYFSGAGNFLYLISTTPKRDKIVTKLNFLRMLHDKLFECMGIKKAFMDNRRSNYRIILKNTEMGVKLFHILDYDVGYRVIYDQSFNIIDLYYQQEELNKFLDCSLDHKKIVFAFLNVYMGEPSLREEINNSTGKSYEDMTFEEMDNYLNLHRMLNI